MSSVTQLLRSELIGRYVKAVKKQDGFEFQGKIIDETRNTLVLKTKKGQKRLVKENFSFEFGDVVVDGTYFKKRPERRIKTRLKNGKN